MSISELSLSVPDDVKRAPIVSRRQAILSLVGLAATVPQLVPVVRETEQVFFDFAKAAFLSPDIRQVFSESERQPSGPPFVLTAEYDQIKDRNLQTVVVGDSIGRGHLDIVSEKNGKIIFTQAPTQYNVANAKTQFINHCQPAEIATFWHNNAQDGATAKDTVRQFETLEIQRGTDITTDFIISVGGNDTKNALASAWEKIHQSDDTISLTSENLTLLAKTIMQSVEAFKVQFDNILTAIENQQKNGVSVKHVFVESLPDAGHIPYLRLPNGAAITMEGEGPIQRLTRHLAGQVATLNNNAMQEVLQKRRTEISYDVVFMNNYSLLTDDDFTGDHPNEQGQQKMANAQLKRSRLRLINGQEESIYDLCQQQVA